MNYKISYTQGNNLLINFYIALRLSTQIPLITWFILILTIWVNLFAFQNIADNKVKIYQAEITNTSNNPDPDKLKAFTELSELDTETQEEYTAVLQELSVISTALQNISDNPELYVSASGTATSTSLSLGWSWTTDKNLPFFAVFNIRTLWEDTPEWRLVTGIIQELTIVNLSWLACIYVLYMFWVRSIFSPIEKVTENIRTIAENGEFSSIKYNKKDEFFPLISSINNLHKSLSIQQRIRSNFLADLSHEIRTPITAVKCYLEAIEDGAMKLDSKTLTLFKTELDRLTSTTEEIMQFERTTHSIEKNIRVERFSMRKWLLPLIQEYLPQCQKNNQSIEIDMPRDTMIRMDEDMFRQIIHNIFSNFIKYSGNNTILYCKYEKNESEIVLTFTDNGLWIPEKDMPYVKEKFYRVDTGRNRDDKSMWIWLSIIDHIMRVHDWIFTIENSEPHWLTISLHFPR